MSNPFFSNLTVTYWSNVVYNDTLASIPASMDLSFEIPLLEEASKYVCAVERLEVSGNAIAYYDTTVDPGVNENGYVTISLLQGQDLLNTEQVWYISGVYYSLSDLINAINNSLIAQANITGSDPGYQFALERNGCISFGVYGEGQADQGQLYYRNYAFSFSSSVLAKIFGLPQNPVGIYQATAYWEQFAQIYYDKNRFTTKYSRIDAGPVPATLVLRSNLPLESDQVVTAKANIVTDFAISQPFQSTSQTQIFSPAFTFQNSTYPQALAVNTCYYQDIAFSLTTNAGGVITYIPQQRRWLNFSAPIPITSARLWIEVVLANNITYPLTLPPGCRLACKLGFWLRDT